jgi:hypothetical protein
MMLAEAMHSMLVPTSRMLGEEVNTMTFRSGHIRDYDVFLANDVVTVINEQVIITKPFVRGLSDFANKAKELKLGWGMLPDFEVNYFYDKGDSNFGYSVKGRIDLC